LALMPAKTPATLNRWLDFSAFLRWWGQGLLLWLPPAWRQALTFSRARLVVVADATQLHLYDERSGKRRELVSYERKSLAEGIKPINAPKADERRVVLSLAPEHVLCTTVNLPLAAENNLQQVVGFEIDRLTPFKSVQVCYDAKIIERLPTNRTLRARLGIVQRELLMPMLAQAQVLGLTPEAVAIEGDDNGLNLLPEGYRRRRLNAGQWRRRMLLFLMFITGLALAALPLWQQRSIVTQLIPRVDTAEQQAQAVLAFRERLDTAVESSQFLLQKRRQTALMIDLLNELTALLPDHTYLEQFSLRDGQLELRGQSAEATVLIGLLEESELFEQATFRSPVVKDNRTSRDRFVISATVVPGLNHAPARIAAVENPSAQDNPALDTVESNAGAESDLMPELEDEIEPETNVEAGAEAESVGRFTESAVNDLEQANVD